MRRDRRWLLLVAALASGCATLNKSECRSANWFQLGSADGALGYPRERLGEHREACSEYGLTADAAEWERGYASGLETFCTASNGYRVGRQGGYYGRVCPAELDREFSSAYALGHETYEVDREIADLNRRIDATEALLTSNGKISDEARRQARYQLSDLYRQMSWLHRSRDRLEAEWRRR